MRRILFTVLAAAALCVAAPAAALAHNGHRGHHHKRHHRLRHEFFKAHPSDTSTSGGSTGSTSQPTAGTVTSFANNVLTITLANGNTVSGDVTNDTEIKCETPDNASADNDADENGGGDEQGDAVFHRGDGGGDNGGWGGGDQGGDNANSQTCTPTPGMAVAKAELTMDGSGAFWNEVELLNSSTSPTTSQS
jgi:hypothetical protein